MSCLLFLWWILWDDKLSPSRKHKNEILKIFRFFKKKIVRTKDNQKDDYDGPSKYFQQHKWNFTFYHLSLLIFFFFWLLKIINSFGLHSRIFLMSIVLYLSFSVKSLKTQKTIVQNLILMLLQFSFHFVSNLKYLNKEFHHHRRHHKKDQLSIPNNLFREPFSI